ncbi:MAG: hypothetical protein ACYTG7_01835 [Planctomycetota bacterium]|jgi:hypothetical protein
MHTLLAFAKVACKDTFRRPGFWISAAAFCAASALSAIPFSPGEAAESVRYREAGLFTLLLGGVFITLMLLPLLLRGGAGRGMGESMLALPAGRASLVAGLYSGFILALLVFFLAGGVLLLLLGALFPGGQDPGNDLIVLAWCWFQTLIVAALVLFLAQYLSYVPAVGISILVLVLGHAAWTLPFPLSICLPAFDVIDPWAMGSRTAWEGMLAFLHGTAFAAFCLILAGVGIRREWAR